MIQTLPPGFLKRSERFTDRHIPTFTTAIRRHRKGRQESRRYYSQNVFNDLKVTWGTYANNLGHTDFPGCFRCHDDSHVASGKKTIGQDCN